jgi:hypothetical protein
VLLLDADTNPLMGFVSDQPVHTDDFDYLKLPSLYSYTYEIFYL